MADEYPILKKLRRLYFWGWAALTPLIILWGIIISASYGGEVRYFLDGLWLGLINLGILWSAAYILISIMYSLARLSKAGDRQVKSVAHGHSFREECLWLLSWGLIVLVTAGFVLEFFAHTFSTGGGLAVALATGLLPVTVAAALIAYVRTRRG